MFDFLKSKKKTPERGAEFDNMRMWMEMYSTTMTDMQNFMSNRELFNFLAGAVFALQQDILIKFSVDLRRTDDMVLAAALDKMQPHPLGPWPDRALMAMKSLHAIDTMNIKTLADPGDSLIGKDETTARLLTLMLKMRYLAARIWLMTMQERIDPKYVGIGVMTIWTMLSAVTYKDIEEHAKLFTGSFFENIKCEKFNKAHWPHMPAPRPGS